MKKFTVLIVLFVVALSLCFSTSEAQTKKKPIVTIDVIGGYEVPMMDMGGDIKDMWLFNGYGTSTAFNTGFSVKYSVLTRDMFQLRVYSTFLYTQASRSSSIAYDLSNGTGNNTINNGWPTIGYYAPVETKGESYMRLNIPSAGVGMEAAVYLDKLNRSSFNFGLDLDISIITGRAYNTYPAPTAEAFYTIPSSTRFGFGLNVMYDIKVAEMLGINVGTRFQWHNLVGKSFSNSDSPWYMPLNDDAFAVGSLTPSGRNIASLSFFTGVSFFIGKR